MITFIIITMLLTAIALAFILIPLSQHQNNVQLNDLQTNNITLFKQQLKELNKDLAANTLDQPQYQTARRDLERALTYDIQEQKKIIAPKSGYWIVPILTITVPILAISLYLLTGNYHAIALSNNQIQTNTNEQTPMNELVERLAERMHNHPDDLQGWLMLGRSSLVLDQKQRAKDAYAQALRLAPKDTEVLLDYANALSEINQSFAGKPYELITTALTINSNNPRALWLIGLAELENAKYTKTIEYWSQLQAQLPPQEKEALALEKLIIETKQKIQ